MCRRNDLFLVGFLTAALVTMAIGLMPVAAAPPAPDETLAPDLPAIPAEPMPVVRHMVEQVSELELLSHVCKLQDKDGGTYCNTQGSRYSLRTEALDEAVRYVADQLTGLGFTVEYDPFIYSSKPMTNVVATLAGSDPNSQDIYIVCAHLDSTASRTSPWNEYRDPAPGADDNASGTAAVLEAARVLSAHQFAHTVRFIAFAGEEQGLIGSQRYAAAAAARGDQIAGVINLDMIGWDGNGDRFMELHAGTLPGSIAIAEHFASTIQRYDLSLVSQLLTTTAVRASDHASFWDRGYPAILAIEDTWVAPTSDFNPYYHTLSDTLDKLNSDYMTHMTRAVVGTLAELAEPVAPDLAVMKIGPELARPGQAITYTITCTNTGSAGAAGVALTDTLPAELTYQGDSSGLPATQVEPGVIRWDLGVLAQGQAISFVLTVTVDSGITALTIVTNTLSTGSDDLELLGGNNAATVESLLCRAPLADFDEDGAVDVDDLMELAARWRARPGDPLYEGRFDLDQDGIISVVDVQLAASQWGEYCD